MNEAGSKKLGFGYMRLPSKGGRFDASEVNAMVDRFLEYGFKYVDTAYLYPGSEEALRESLVKRHPREKFWITTKLAMMEMKKPEEQEAMLQESLSRLGVSYVDAYFIHALDGSYIEKADKLDTWGFMRSVKERGIAKHIGFSYHGTPEDLDTILTNHPELEFVQLQINYLDWDNPSVRSRELYEITRRHGRTITVMEPCKGGLLAGEASEAAKLLTAANPSMSAASWAFRFVLGLDGIEAILSGMGDISQMDDNARTFLEYTPLSESEKMTLDEAVRIINATPRVPCTSCKYCVAHCPKNIMIPAYIKLYNDYLVHQDKTSSGYQYTRMGSAQALDCVKCGACVKHCPQHINIPDALAELASEVAPAAARYILEI